jgi:LPS-assembly protein
MPVERSPTPPNKAPVSPASAPQHGRRDTQQPTMLRADHVHSTGPNETIARGDVELQRGRNTLLADRLTYWQDEDEVEAVGNVVLMQDKDRISGPKLRLKLEENTGFFETPKYSITRAPAGTDPSHAITGSGQAERIDFEGENLYRLKKATYSTCGPDDPDWYAKSGSVFLDYDQEVGEARNMTVVFKGVPFLYAPWAEFSLNNKRKSGLLAPTLGSSSTMGVSILQPYYWNIAPNMDATIAPHYMSKRGLQLGGEFRYLEPSYQGVFHGEYLPNDQVTGTDRSAYSWQHTQTLPFGVVASANVNHVSDDTYFTDLASRNTITSHTNLLRQGLLSYGGGWWSAQALVQRYQTLQDPAKPTVVKPYDKLPQLLLIANRPDVKGFSFAMTADYTDFHSASRDNGRRALLYPQLTYPLEGASYFVRPKIGLHFTRYDLDRQTSSGPDTITRTLPITSVDSGLIFERGIDWFGRGVTQTLEPRLYYLGVPARDQSQIPVFDSALADYNFAQIFSENIFSGSDRIADANQLTAAVSSRLIEQNGVELIRATIGQRYYFRDQTVTLPGVPARDSRTANLLAALSGKLTQTLSFDSALEYNSSTRTGDKVTLAGRYQPGVNRVLNASYRFRRGVLEEVDVSGQWPLYRRWYGVGRYNYSLAERRLIEAIAGMEYNGGCWVGRFVVQRFATNSFTTNSSFFFQLELNGFSRIGSNPLDMLSRNIPGYGRVIPSAADPVFGGL